MGEKLTVNIVSFSYKKGLPEAGNEHGGGHVFDCRCLPNPGREEKYKDQTGLDKSVQEFLQVLPEVALFRENAFGLVEQSVSQYLERNFTSLAVAFGCTGGQHRSVYFAEQLGAYLKETFPIEVSITHRDKPK